MWKKEDGNFPVKRNEREKANVIRSPQSLFVSQSTTHRRSEPAAPKGVSSPQRDKWCAGSGLLSNRSPSFLFSPIIFVQHYLPGYWTFVPFRSLEQQQQAEEKTKKKNNAGWLRNKLKAFFPREICLLGNLLSPPKRKREKKWLHAHTQYLEGGKKPVTGRWKLWFSSLKFS